MKASDELKYEHDTILLSLKILEQMSVSLSLGASVEQKDLRAMVEFFILFSEKCHHGKEEDIFFPALEKAGIARYGGPIGIMLTEHQEGRGYIRLMSDALEHEPFHRDKFIKGAGDYVKLIRSHIEKENSRLFPEGDSKLSAKEHQEIIEKFEKFEENVIGEKKHQELHRMLEDFREKYLKSS